MDGAAPVPPGHRGKRDGESTRRLVWHPPRAGTRGHARAGEDRRRLRRVDTPGVLATHVVGSTPGADCARRRRGCLPRVWWETPPAVIARHSTIPRRLTAARARPSASQAPARRTPTRPPLGDDGRGGDPERPPERSAAYPDASYPAPRRPCVRISERIRSSRGSVVAVDVRHRRGDAGCTAAICACISCATAR